MNAHKDIDSTRDEVLTLLLTIKAISQWVLAGLLSLGGLGIIGTGTLTWFILSDHYDQSRLREQMDKVEPRVTYLWQKSYPDEKPSSESSNIDFSSYANHRR